jgi:hypothetical protein
VSATVETACPSIATIRSPARIPAAAAGDGSASSGQVRVAASAGSTHSGMALTVLVAPGMPKAVSTMVKNSTASTRLWNGPANITMTRCHQGFL